MKDEQEFCNKIDDFVKSLLGLYQPRKIRDRKVIHDALYGSNIFYEHEITVLDTPLLQRLRQVHQTGLCFLTFPTSIHSRFDHTLGVMSLVNRFVKVLNIRKQEEIKTYITEDPYRGDLAHLRMAALLHDSGHSFFSHASEQIYETYNIINKLKEQPRFSDCSAHEILSYYIVKSASFNSWFKENIREVKIDLDTVANMIIGEHKDPEKFYLAEIINGPFDADKLDYITRDSFFSGLKLVIDIERLFHTITTWYNSKTKKQHLILKSYIPMEQIVFSKMMLFSTLYHHQKVKSCDSMLNSLIDYMNHYAPNFPCPFKGRFLNDPVDYLQFTDYDILDFLLSENDHFIQQLIRNLIQRNLYMRALTISASTIKNWRDCYQAYITRAINSKSLRNELQKNIWDDISPELKKKYNLYPTQIQVSLPKIPPIDEDETLNAYVLPTLKGDPVPVRELFPVGEWLMGYMDRKWKGHIFCPPEDEVRNEVYRIAIEILSNKGIEFDEDRCRWASHIY